MQKFVILMLAVTAATLLPALSVEIIAHRGASYDAPENTVASSKLGYAQKADGGECDVYLTRDGKIMLMHDTDTVRTAGVSNRMDRTTSAHLRTIEVGQWGKFKNAGFSEKIPFLMEVLATVPKGKKIVVEIKCGAEILPQLEKDLAASGLKDDQIVIICFNYDVISKSKAKMPQYRALWLVGQDRKTSSFPPVEQLIKKTKAASLDGLNLNYGFPIDRAFVQKVHDAGLKLYTWTVDDPEVARRQVAAGVDGITTNRPEWLRQQLAVK